jgi:hypothetical protein
VLFLEVCFATMTAALDGVVFWAPVASRVQRRNCAEKKAPLKARAPDDQAEENFFEWVDDYVW